ncbi:MAG: hypothetical protein LBV16_09360 [Elusimicrobiota bacterium]|jgi:hypothetical protein|nr:hypothetical protein [Elusimicrobiota bacterium]
MDGKNLIYDYVLKINVISGVAAADMGFLRKALVVVKPKSTWEQTDEVIEATKATISDITDNTDIVRIFDGGATKILVIATEDLAGIKDIYEGSLNQFYSLVISSDFTSQEIAALDAGNFKSVLFSSSADAQAAGIQAKKLLNCCYYKQEGNLMYVIGKFLAQPTWSNLQYEILPLDDAISDIADAENLFENGVSFSLKDSQSANRLSLFAQGNEAIIAPYVLKEIELKLQSETINWIALNRPSYNEVDCSILGQYLQGKVIAPYINNRIIPSGSVNITTEGGQNFVASGNIVIPKPTALWRVKANLQNA